jgi:hypothetical protein
MRVLFICRSVASLAAYHPTLQRSFKVDRKKGAHWRQTLLDSAVYAGFSG